MGTERTFGDNHKVKLGKEHSETNGIKLGKMTSSFWVAPDALGILTDKLSRYEDRLKSVIWTHYIVLASCPIRTSSHACAEVIREW